MSIRKKLTPILAAVALALNGTSCSRNDEKRTQEPEIYLTGTIRGEKFERERFNGPGIDRYSFSLETDKEIKSCKVLGVFSASKIDALLNIEDTVKILLERGQTLEQGSYHFEGRQFKEVNGKQYHFEY